MMMLVPLLVRVAQSADVDLERVEKTFIILDSGNA